MSERREVPDSVLVSYGLLAGGARALIPAVFDLPFVRTVRGAMFERLARAAGVTLTAEARRVLVDLDQTTSKRGALEQGLRWAAGRFIPGAGIVDGARNVMFTYGAGVIFQRYLAKHRPNAGDTVMNGAEAEQVRRAIRHSVAVMSVEHLRSVTRLAGESWRKASASAETSLVQRYSDAVVTAVAELPVAWVEVMDQSFAKALEGGAEGDAATKVGAGEPKPA